MSLLPGDGEVGADTLPVAKCQSGSSEMTLGGEVRVQTLVRPLRLGSRRVTLHRQRPHIPWRPATRTQVCAHALRGPVSGVCGTMHRGQQVTV